MYAVNTLLKENKCHVTTCSFKIYRLLKKINCQHKIVVGTREFSSLKSHRVTKHLDVNSFSTFLFPKRLDFYPIYGFKKIAADDC